MGNAMKHVLSVGQCQPDHQSIQKFIEANFQAEVHYAADINGALSDMSERAFDLVLVNRIIDSNADEGMDLVVRMKQSEFLRNIPVMIVSNFVAAQQEAVKAGAVEGFGKAALGESETKQRLAAVLVEGS